MQYLFQSNVFIKTASWIWLLTIAYLSLSPQPNLPINFNHSDKLLHLAAYGLATLLILKSYPLTNKLYLITLLSIYSLSIEIAQLFVENRFFEIMDIIANIIGIFLGALFYKKYLNNAGS
ncbi:MAG: VanZ family protein [Candidatus Brocadiales bacterium]|nr:VanZ family protein [Candidatus Brocadiales bacterium]